MHKLHPFIIQKMEVKMAIAVENLRESYRKELQRRKVVNTFSRILICALLIGAIVIIAVAKKSVCNARF